MNKKIMNKKNMNKKTAASDVRIITESGALAELCAGWSNKDYLTIDTEFLRSSSYWPQLCLIQVAHAGEGVLIDPLAADIDLTPFFALMTKPDIVKVFHAARQDIEIFYHMERCIPTPVVDTQIAAMVCGFGDAVSYERLAKVLLGRTIDKSSRVTDWSQRPLSERQMVYALSDVTHLCDIYQLLTRRIHQENRKDWVAPEFIAMTKPEIYENVPDQAWRQLRFQMKTDTQQAMLIAIASWRETEAQRLDKPRGWIMRDDLMRDISLSAAKGAALESIRNLPKNLLHSRGGENLRAAIADASRFENQFEKPVKTKTINGDASMSMMKLLLKVQCEKNQVAPKLVASSQIIEDLASNNSKNSPLLTGWRYEVFGQYAQALLNGEISLTLDKGQPQIIKTQPALKPRAREQS